MCGLTGYWDVKGRHTSKASLDILAGMTGSLQHRGPDDEGHWQDPEAGVGLGFRRLSILDLSPEGHQPMQAHSGRHAMVFNGEIYNFQELRAELGGSWRGHSDSEVVLEAIEHWGLETALTRFNGMFAMALWDKNARVLNLARDSFGKKPLYYGWGDGVFLFGSELKALRRHPAFCLDLDREAMAAFLRFGYIPGPATVYCGIRKLPPGTFLRLGVPVPGQLPGPEVYWDSRVEAFRAREQGFGGSFQEATDELEALLLDATRRRCVADVPLGAFLSGGIDSSLVTALMQQGSHSPARTFTIGFEERDFDEAPYAKAVAHHLGTEHTELYLASSEAREVIPLLPTVYDEPFADPSQIPTFLLSRMTRQHVTVALSGDGGDELFGGYDRYRVGQMLMGRFQKLPQSLRRMTAWACGQIPGPGWDRTMGALLGPRWSSSRFQKLGRLMLPEGSQAVYRDMMSYWQAPEQLLSLPSNPGAPAWRQDSLPADWEPVSRMMLTDTLTYLVDDILVKVDRASMANSLEVRNPLLDKRVFTFAWRLPLAFKLDGGQGKQVLKEILHRHVPRELVERKKMGFGVPLGAWLRGPLRPWAEALLRPDRLAEAGIARQAVDSAWQGFCHRGEPNQDRLWPLLVLLQWMESQGVGH
ncbi:asparagine synthase (glutamine-hydrolyzing) [Geothrix sp.]|jgi:asparagine synthase (glutamine-hydrolysing)|uniref:asparagine synthase (glutamine-hydrolyzing) n=1 Tax=Geothrix sp. TaxID=1962974 RepID=UPI0025C605F3|nr:asparagine synthase (glutamine-hydrolyzing) [Geothrix sp.]